MTSVQVVETSVTNNSSFQNYHHPDSHAIQTVAVKVVQNVLMRGVRCGNCDEKKKNIQATFRPREIHTYIARAEKDIFLAFRVQE